MFRGVFRLAAISAFAAMAAFSFAVTSSVCIDPGHGGSDPGASSSSGGVEANNVLNTGLKFKAWLDKDTNDGAGGGSWSTVMTRTTDVYVTLQGRCDVANNAGSAYFMCIHNNASGVGGHGTETYSVATTGNGADLRNKVQYRMLNAWGLTDRGNKTANYYVLVNTNMPAELAELGFIDAAPDYDYVDSSASQDSAALAHLYAIQTRCGLTAYTPQTAATYIVDNSSAGFTASANWSTGTSATDKYGADYRYRATAAVSDAAQWSASIATAGNYDVSAWWAAGSNRSATAPYVLPDSSTVSVNQQANGGKWNLLGTKSLAAGANVTKLSCWTTTGFIVLADAVKYYGPK